MTRKVTPEEAVAAEIERLKNTDAVKLALKDQRLQTRKKKWLYQLRWLEKRGLKLMEDGWTLETIELLYADIPEESAVIVCQKLEA